MDRLTPARFAAASETIATRWQLAAHPTCSDLYLSKKKLNNIKKLGLNVNLSKLIYRMGD